MNQQCSYIAEQSTCVHTLRMRGLLEEGGSELLLRGISTGESSIRPCFSSANRQIMAAASVSNGCPSHLVHFRLWNYSVSQKFMPSE